MFLLRKLVIYFRQLPAQTAHSIFNYLVRWQHDNHVFSYVFICEHVLPPPSPPPPPHTQSLSVSVCDSLSPPTLSLSLSFSLSLCLSVCLSVSRKTWNLEMKDESCAHKRMVFSFVVFYVFLVCFEEGIWWGKKEEKAKKGKHTVMETVDVRLLVRYCMVRCELFQHWSNASAASICAWTGNCAPPPPPPPPPQECNP